MKIVLTPQQIEYARKPRDAQQRVSTNFLRARRRHMGESARQQKKKAKALRRLPYADK